MATKKIYSPLPPCGPVWLVAPGVPVGKTDLFLWWCSLADDEEAVHAVLVLDVCVGIWRSSQAERPHDGMGVGSIPAVRFR